jgi:hypothetical protein
VGGSCVHGTRDLGRGTGALMRSSRCLMREYMGGCGSWYHAGDIARASGRAVLCSGWP